MNARRAGLSIALCLAAGCGEQDHYPHCASHGSMEFWTTTRSEALTVGGVPAGFRCWVTAGERDVWIDCSDPAAGVRLPFVTPAEDGVTEALGEGHAVDRDGRCGPPPGEDGYPVAVEGLVTRLETREGQEGPDLVLHVQARLAETWTADERGDACLVFPAAELDLVFEGRWLEVVPC